jgi:predicted transposase/invertase (TIGR01784 family)
MKRDSLFYNIFQQYPALLFELLENPPENAANYRFESVAVKEPKFEIDGVFLPPETTPPGIVYFCVRVACRRQVQFQKDERLYERLFAESAVYFYRNRERFRNWQAVIIYPSRSIEQTDYEPYRCNLESYQVHRIYLDELGKIEDLPLEVGLLLLTTVKQEDAPATARYLVNRTQQEERPPEANNVIIEIISKILSYQFIHLTRVEIDAMLGISFQQTGLYLSVKEEEARTFVLRLLTKRFGEVPNQLKSQIEQLSLEQLENLGEALLDFTSSDDLVAWLQSQEVSKG